MKPLSGIQVEFNSITTAICFAILLLASTSTTVMSQERKSRFDPVDYLRKLDANRNGMLDPSEVSGRTEDWLKKMGFDTDRPMSLKKVLSKLDKDRKERESERDSRSGSSVSTLKVAGFGPSDSGSAVPGFGLSVVTPLSTNFSKDVERQVEETLERYDKNKNGMLDRDEVEKARWGSPRPSESDSNGDGKLSRVELANRYYAREQYRRTRDDDDDDDDDDDRKKSKDYSKRRDYGSSSSKSRVYSPSGGRSSFGSTSRSSSRTSSGSSSSSSSGSSGADRSKYESYVGDMIVKYDKNKDGKLSKTEIKEMRRPIVGADADGDGYVTKNEYFDHLSGNKPGGSSSSSSSKKSTESKSGSKESRRPKGRSSSGSSSSFDKLDKNTDQRIEMHEFATEWDEDKVKEFYEKDKNGDGVITAKEWSGR